MDVGLLMRDKGVQELDSLQTTLQAQVEQQREELREMVGRRYRDVLDASSEVRTVHALAESLVSALSSSRSTVVPAEALAPSGGGPRDIQRFLALHRLLPLVGNDDSLDALNDAYALVLCESLHRSLVTASMDDKMARLIPSLSRRLVLTRRNLVADLPRDLSLCGRADWAGNQLAAVALVHGKGVEQLLDQYLAARKKRIQLALEVSSSLLAIVGEVKATLRVVEELFSHGEMLRVLQAIGAPTFRPSIVWQLEAESPFVSFSSVLATEAEAVNRMQRERKIGSVLTATINEKCAAWIEDVCTLARPTVEMIVGCYESLDDVIAFLHALGEVLADNWPRLGSSSASFFYHRLFGSIVVDRFKCLLSTSMSSLSSSFSSSLPSLSSLAPFPLFEKRPSKFDQLLAVGISQSLNNAVQTLYSGVASLRDTCTRLEKAVAEGASAPSDSAPMASVKETLADEVVVMIERLSATPAPSSSSISSADSLLWPARICLALLHCDAPAMCKVLNRDGVRITRCSQALHSAIEASLSSFVVSVAEECLSVEGGAMGDLVASAETALTSIDLALEWDKFTLQDVGEVEVPSAITGRVHSALVELCRRCSDASVSHLLSRGVRQKATTAIGGHLTRVYDKILGEDPSRLLQRTLLQLLFDCRVLSTLFPSSSPNGDLWRGLIFRLESCVDPFDLSLLSPLLAANTKMAVQRTQLTMACLLLDILPSKDISSSSVRASQAAVDLLPRANHDFRPRISMIPRLDRTVGESAKGPGSGGPRVQKNSLLAVSGATPSMASKPSLSSFYDKASMISSWFNG